MFISFLKFCGYMLILLSVVPLTGLMVFGNKKQAWAYTKDWFKAIGWIVLVGGILALIVTSLT
jgi:hypothetical protein